VPRHHLTRECSVERSPRVKQIESLFDVPAATTSRNEWTFETDIDADDWSIGLIVGASGSGKTTAARELFGEHIVEGYDWSATRALLDDFPNDVSTRDIATALGKVGFSTPPAWMRPFGTLSNGEQFRATVARALIEEPELVVLDEFTSVVDRQVARVASAAIAKHVRRMKRRFVAVTCHYDVIDWLQPDWILDMADSHFARRSVQPRPRVDIEIRQTAQPRAAWRLFARHHYLTAELHSACRAFVALVDGAPVAFNSFLHFPHARTRNIKRGHRLVVLPDWQGLGIGPWFDDWLGEWLHARGFRYHNSTANPTMIRAYSRSPRWQMLGRGARLKSGPNAKAELRKSQRQTRRLSTASFGYVPLKGGAS